MKTNFILGIMILTLFSGCQTSNEKSTYDDAQNNFDTVKFTFTSFDSIELPAQLIITPGSKRTVLFLNGSTPYDEKGNIGSLLPGNQMIKARQDFYVRFIEVMTRKGYDVATFSKRSFTYPHLRPSLDELAKDAYQFIDALENKSLLKDLIIVGYSEGSRVASMLVKHTNANACILLGSASTQFDYVTGDWKDWPMGKAYKRIRGWNDEQVKKEYEQWSDIMCSLQNMDEAYFESEYKTSNPHGFGFAPWESFRIDRAVQFYNPTDDLVQSGAPVLIVIGEKDLAMPMEFARRTYEDLLAAGHDAQFYLIPDEGHQYSKYDVFAVMHSWIEGEEDLLSFDDTDREIMDQYEKITKITTAISRLSYDVPNPEIDTLFLQAEAISYRIPDRWFKLALVLFNNGKLEESFKAFDFAADPDFAIYYAPLAWKGHILDIQGHREEAIEYYKKALEYYPGFPVQHDHWGIVLTEEYIKGRMEEPFKGVK